MTGKVKNQTTLAAKSEKTQAPLGLGQGLREKGGMAKVRRIFGKLFESSYVLDHLKKGKGHLAGLVSGTWDS